jgi:hypothetical protein
MHKFTKITGGNQELAQHLNGKEYQQSTPPGKIGAMGKKEFNNLLINIRGCTSALERSPITVLFDRYLFERLFARTRCNAEDGHAAYNCQYPRSRFRRGRRWCFIQDCSVLSRTIRPVGDNRFRQYRFYTITSSLSPERSSSTLPVKRAWVHTVKSSVRV